MILRITTLKSVDITMKTKKIEGVLLGLTRLNYVLSLEITRIIKVLPVPKVRSVSILTTE